MITLTTPPIVKSVLGGTATVSYDKFIIEHNRLSTLDKEVNSTLRISSSANPEMTPINGSLKVNCNTRVVEMLVQQLDFYRRVVLTQGQADAVFALITGAQNDLESGLISLGLVAGVQSAGV